jgi:perosamine synthetase
VDSLIPHSRPFLGHEEAAEVQRVVLSGMIAQGAEVEHLERELAERFECPLACCVAHGTGALHLSLLGLGAGPGKQVVLPSYSCASLLNAVVYTGAEPVLVDSLADVPDVDLSKIAVGPDTVAIVVPHLFGRTVPLQSFTHRKLVVEDATHAVGAGMVGQFGAACVYSFYATKMLAGGEGGVITTAAPKLDRLVRDLRSYDQRPDWKLRFNYKMTDMGAALLRVQLRRLSGFLERRAALARFYRDTLADVPGLILPQAQTDEVNYRFVLRFPDRAIDRVQQSIGELGVATVRPVWKTLHQCLKESGRLYPNAQRWWRESLSIPLYPALSDGEAERVVAAVRAAAR